MVSSIIGAITIVFQSTDDEDEDEEDDPDPDPEQPDEYPEEQLEEYPDEEQLDDTEFNFFY